MNWARLRVRLFGATTGAKNIASMPSMISRYKWGLRPVDIDDGISAMSMIDFSPTITR